MAENESAAKRTREGPKAPVKPEPAPIEAELDAESRARTLAGLLRAESAAATPPDESNGNGHVGSHLDGLQRASRNGLPDGHHAVQPADLRTLQRLAGNAAVRDLMGPAPRPRVQRAAIGPSPPEQMELLDSPERKAAEKRAAEAIGAWVAAAPKSEEEKATSVEEVGEEPAEAPAAAEPGESAVGATEEAEVSGMEEPGAEGPAAAGADVAAADTAAEGSIAEGEVGPGAEAESEARETLAAARAERAEAAVEPPPSNVRLAGPSLGELLGPAAVTSAAAAGPLGLVAPIAGLVTGAAARSAADAASGASGQRPHQARSGGSVSTTGRAGRGHRRLGPATAGPRPSAVRPRPSASRVVGPSAVRGGPPNTAVASPAAAFVTGPQGAEGASTDLAPAVGLSTAMDASPASAAATPPGAPPPTAPPPTTPAQPPQSPTPSPPPPTAPEGAHEQTPALASRTPTALAEPSDPARPSPLVAAVQPTAEPSRPTALATAPGSAAERAAQAVTAAPDGDAPAMERGFVEQQAPARAGGGGGGARSRGGGAARGGGAPRAGGGTPTAPPAAPKPVPLGDAALEQWRSASGEAISGTKAEELTEAKEAPGKVEEAGTEIDSTRRGEQPDYEADAKDEQPEMPQEPDKDQVLDTSPAEAAVQAVVTSGEARLSDQTFRDLGAPPAYPGLNPSDYVPRQSDAYKAMKDLEKRLAGEGLTDEERVSLTEQLEKAKAAVQEIGEKAQKGTAEPPPTVVDEGPAKLEPPDPAMGDLMGDVIARELGRVGERANEIRDTALGTIKGTSVPAVTALGDEEASTVKTELTTELNGIAEAAGVTEEQLKAKIEEQKEAVKAEEKAVEEGLAAASATATKQVEKRTQEESEDIGGAKVAVDKEIQQKQEAVQGPPDTEAIEKKRDEFLGKIETVGAQALAGLKSSLGKRESALDSSGGKQRTAAKQAADNQAAAIRRHWEADADPNKGMTEARPTVRWGTTRATAVDTEVGQKKTAAKAESDRLSTTAQDTIKQSKNAVRDWAAAQEGRERSWWEKLWDSIVDWGKQAAASSEAWEKQRNADSRDKMADDFKALTTMKTELAKGNQKAAMKELGAMDAEQQKLANLYLKGGISSIEFVARSTIGRIKSRRAPELAKKIEQRAIAELDYEDLTMFAQQQGNPGFNAGTLANQIRGAVSGLGTDEDAVYAALGKVNTAVERAALDKAYQALHGTSMESDVKSDMSGRELDRALALKEGRNAEAAAAAMAYAMEGIGTDEETVRSQLRGKTPEEIKAIKEAYEKQTGRTLDTDIADDMSGAELDNALALSSGDPLAADAAELQIAMEGAGTDEKGLEKVYDRIREEEEARAKREGLTPAELQANVQERNSKLKTAYNNMYGHETGGLDAALRDELDDADLGVMDALDEGDATKIDAAMANREHESLYADDDKLEEIVRNQHKQADLEVNLELTAEKARMKAQLDSGDVAVEDYKTFSKDWDQRYKDRDKEISKRSRDNMNDLRGAYSQATNGTQTFDQLIAQETQGFSQLEIQDLVAAGGKLSDEKELYYATAGVGTDEDKIKEIFKGKTPDEIKALRKKYKDHLGRDMDDDVLSDLSGRENLDVGHTMKYGDPDTFARQLAEAETPEKRREILANMRTMMNERKSFEETGLIGGVFAMGADPLNSAAQLEQALQRAEEYEQTLSALDGLSDEERAKALKDPAVMAAQAKLQMNVESTIEAQEQVRKQIDAYADAAAQVGAAVAAVAVTIVTAGTAGPVLAAAYGAMAAAATTVYMKATLKGAAYGWEDLGTDVAIGAVDAAVSAATAGAGKVIMQAMQKAIAKQMARMAAREGAEAAIKSGAKQALKSGVKEGAEEATESAAQAWLKEAAEEAIEGALGGAPTAAFEAAISDDTWKSGDPWGAIVGAGGMGGLMGGGMGVGAKAGLDAAGAGYGALKGKLGSGKADIGTPDAPSLDADGMPTDASTPTIDEPDVPDLDMDLPPQADPGAAAKAASEGELPPGVSEGDLGLPPGTMEAEAKAHKGAEGKSDADLEADARADAEGRKPGDIEGEADLGTRPAEADADVPRADVDEPPPMRQPDASGVDDTLVDIEVSTNKPSTDDVGKPLSMNDLETRYGMPADNVKAINNIADEAGVIIDIRPTSTHATDLLKNNAALPKPAQIKTKTLNDIDVMIGLGSKDDLGKVFVVVEPSRIRRPKDYGPEMSEGLRTAIDKRIKQRLEEFADYKKKLDEMAQPTKGPKGEDIPPLIRIDENGMIVNVGLKPGKGELPFTGDHDIFDIRARDGSQLSQADYEAAVDKLTKAGVGVEHGSVVGWRTDSPDTFNTPQGQKSYDSMVNTHSEGGSEPLVRIGEGEPKAAWYEPAPPPRDSDRLFSDPEIDHMLKDIPPKADVTPEGTVGMLNGAEALDPHKNMEFYRNWVKDDPYREVGLLYNTASGKYAVVQGSGTWVDTPGNYGNKKWMEDLLDADEVGEGHWLILSHSHPVELGGKYTPQWAQWPSSADGDFGHVAWQSKMMGQPMEGHIEYVAQGPDGKPEPRTMRYGYDDTAEKPYWIERPEFPGQQYRFKTIDEYDAWYRSHYHAPQETPGAMGATKGSDVEGTTPPVETTTREEGAPSEIEDEPTQKIDVSDDRSQGDGPDIDDDVTQVVEPAPPASGDEVTEAFGPDKTQELEPPTTRRGSDAADSAGSGDFDADDTIEMELPAGQGEAGAFDPDVSQEWDPDQTQVWDPQKTQVDDTTTSPTAGADTTQVWEPDSGKTVKLPAQEAPSGSGGAGSSGFGSGGAGSSGFGSSGAGSSGPSAASTLPNLPERGSSHIDVPEALGSATPTRAGRGIGEPETAASLRDTGQYELYRGRQDWEMAGIPSDRVNHMGPPDCFDGAKNRSLFEQIARVSPQREAGLAYNVRTREYVVIQGNDDRVMAGSDWLSEMARDSEAQSAGWILLAHTHPAKPGRSYSDPINQYPSMRDWNAIAHQAERLEQAGLGGGVQTSEILYWLPPDSRGPARMQSMMWSYDPDPLNPRPYSMIHERRGVLERRSFETVDAYHDYLVGLGFRVQPVPAGLKGRRRQAPVPTAP